MLPYIISDVIIYQNSSSAFGCCSSRLCQWIDLHQKMKSCLEVIGHTIFLIFTSFVLCVVEKNCCKNYVTLHSLNILINLLINHTAIWQSVHWLLVQLCFIYAWQKVNLLRNQPVTGGGLMVCWQLSPGLLTIGWLRVWWMLLLLDIVQWTSSSDQSRSFIRVTWSTFIDTCSLQ